MSDLGRDVKGIAEGDQPPPGGCRDHVRRMAGAVSCCHHCPDSGEDFVAVLDQRARRHPQLVDDHLRGCGRPRVDTVLVNSPFLRRQYIGAKLGTEDVD